MSQTKEKRIVQAPPSSGSARPGAVLDVELEEGEKVEWTWTHYPDGSKAVTGYSVAEGAAG